MKKEIKMQLDILTIISNIMDMIVGNIISNDVPTP
jgi:hypothetical protein